MVDAVADMPPGTVGFRISGGLSREEYVRALVPPLHEAVERGERLRVLYQIDHGLSMTPGAMWEDLKLEPEMGIKHRDAWDRIALVTDIDWLWRSFELFSWMVPGEMRMFHDSELEIAKQWLAGPGA
ncbi:MAG: STAS/SEC14 domain-containing protein [Solirubrobacteraceae bacterium]